MKILNLFQGETEVNDYNPFRISSEAVINMVGVILFYVVFFVAFSIFSG